MNFDENIKHNIKRLFTSTKLDLLEISKTLEIHIDRLFSFVYGDGLPSLDECAKICFRFNVSIDWLLTGKEATPPQLFSKSALQRLISELNDEPKRTVTPDRDLEIPELSTVEMTRKTDDVSDHSKPKLQEFFEKIEKATILRKLEETNWNISKTARQLGIGRATVYRKIQKYGILKSGSSVTNQPTKLSNYEIKLAQAELEILRNAIENFDGDIEQAANFLGLSSNSLKEK